MICSPPEFQRRAVCVCFAVVALLSSSGIHAASELAPEARETAGAGLFDSTGIVAKPGLVSSSLHGELNAGDIGGRKLMVGGGTGMPRVPRVTGGARPAPPRLVTPVPSSRPLPATPVPSGKPLPATPVPSSKPLPATPVPSSRPLPATPVPTSRPLPATPVPSSKPVPANGPQVNPTRPPTNVNAATPSPTDNPTGPPPTQNPTGPPPSTNAATPPPNGQPDSKSTYSVREGDTCDGIAKSNGVSLQKIEDANPGKCGTSLQIGETLSI